MAPAGLSSLWHVNSKQVPEDMEIHIDHTGLLGVGSMLRD